MLICSLGLCKMAYEFSDVAQSLWGSMLNQAVSYKRFCMVLFSYLGLDLFYLFPLTETLMHLPN